ncbi:histamine N-methyltransferase-like [Glandiceps talaboti]
MSGSDMKSIYKEDKDYYFKAYKIILSKIDATSLPALQEQWDKHWTDILMGVPFDADNDSEIQMLTVGSGEGYRDCLIIKHLVQRYPRVYVRVIEPVMEQVKLFKDKTVEIKKEHPGVSFDWHIKTFEKYLEDCQAEDKDHGFHLVVACHSLYYMDVWRCALDHMCNLVKTNGLLTVTMTRGDSDCGTLLKKYRQLEGNDMHLMLSDDVHSYLMTKTTNLKVDAYPRTSLYDISEVFDEKSETGNMILDFIMERAKFRETAPQNFQDEVLTFLKDNSSEKDGGQWFRGDEEDVVAKILS